MRRLPSRLAGIVAGSLAAALLVSGCSGSTRVALPPVPGASSGAGRAPAAPAAVPAPLEHAVRDLFTVRFAGLERGDRSGWLGGVRGGWLAAEQRVIFDRMRALGVSDLRVAAVSRSGADDVPGTAERRVQVRCSYRLAGFDTSPREFALDVTVAGTTATTAGVTLTASRPADRPEPWDLPDLQVRRTAGMLVAVSGTGSRAEDVAADAAAAARRVAAVLGRPRPAVVVAPSTDALAARLLGRDPGGLDGVSAVTDGPLEGGLAHADRVVIVPSAWSSLSTTGREVVLAHELTHVTTRAETGSEAPLWLSEGLAEYVAYDGVPLPEATIVAPALGQVRRSGQPTQWPADAQFEPGSATQPAAYGLALLACRSIAERHGQAALLRFYRAAATGTVAAGFRAIGTDALKERRAWQARIRGLLDRSAQP